MADDRPEPVEVILPQGTDTQALLAYTQTLTEYHVACWSGLRPVGAELRIVWQAPPTASEDA